MSSSIQKFNAQLKRLAENEFSVWDPSGGYLRNQNFQIFFEKIPKVQACAAIVLAKSAEICFNNFKMESSVGLNTQPVLQEQRWIFSIKEMFIFTVFR